MNCLDLTKAQRIYTAERLAEDRLERINMGLEDVHPRVSFYTKYGKRFFDILISGFALIVTLPINLILGVCTFLDVGNPIFFHQERLGRNGTTFTITKLRNMRNTRDERGELLPPEQRVTKFGKFIRKTSMDELLNFWPILKGDMSIIGPRPLLPEHKVRFNKRHIMRLAVRPGLECPPRMSRMDHAWTWQEQFDNDVWYVENISLRTDIFLLWQLVKYTFDRKNSEMRAAAGRGIFMGYDLEGRVITLEEVPQSYIDECEARR